MELLQERIQEPGPPVTSVTHQNGVGNGDDANQRTRNSKNKITENLGNASKYYNSNFAQFDTICGGENYFERVPTSQYQNHYQNPGPSQGKTANGSNGMNSISMENGCLNIHIPCAYTSTYAYEPTKPMKIPEVLKKQMPQKKTQDKIVKSQSRSSLASSSKSKRSRSRPRDACYNPCYDPCVPVPPFCSTVKSLRGPPNKGYFSTDLPECGGPPQGRVQTSMKWDFESGVQIPVKKVDYGEELYERAVQNLTKQLALEKTGNGIKTKENLSTALDAIKMEERCRDFSKPGFHSSLKVTNELAKALDRLNRLPAQMERIFLTDNRFEPIVNDRATKVLNVPREQKVFKDLASFEPSSTVKDRVTKSISDQIKAVKPVTRSRDAEPNLLDYQQVSFSRIKPKPLPPPPKPQAGIGVDIRSQTQYQMINTEKQFEEDADKL